MDRNKVLRDIAEAIVESLSETLTEVETSLKIDPRKDYSLGKIKRAINQAPLQERGKLAASAVNSVHRRIPDKKYGRAASTLYMQMKQDKMFNGGKK